MIKVPLKHRLIFLVAVSVPLGLLLYAGHIVLVSLILLFFAVCLGRGFIRAAEAHHKTIDK